MKKIIFVLASSLMMAGSAYAQEAFVAQIGNNNNAGNIQVNQPTNASNAYIVQNSQNGGVLGGAAGQTALNLQSGGGNYAFTWQEDLEHTSGAGVFTRGISNITSANHSSLNWQTGSGNTAIAVQMMARTDMSSTILQDGDNNTAVNWQSSLVNGGTVVPTITPALTTPTLGINPGPVVSPVVGITANASLSPTAVSN